MKHFTLPRFWEHYRDLPDDIQDLADRKFELLKSNPCHPSLHLKKIEAHIKSVMKLYATHGLQDFGADSVVVESNLKHCHVSGEVIFVHPSKKP